MNQTTFLVLGGNSRLAEGFQKLYPTYITRLSKEECNILEEQSIRETFKKHKEKYILNCAAITDLLYCEKNPKECLAVNAIGPYLLNTICQEFGKKLINISSDYASKEINIYGLSKYIGEKMVDKTMLTIRTNFYDEKTFIIKELLRQHTVETYSNIFFNPISINRLIREIITKKDKQGLFNIFSDKKISFSSFASKVCRAFNLDKNLITKVVYKNNDGTLYRPLSSYIKSDITVDIRDDLQDFKYFLIYANK